MRAPAQCALSPAKASQGGVMARFLSIFGVNNKSPIIDLSISAPFVEKTAICHLYVGACYDLYQEFVDHGCRNRPPRGCTQEWPHALYVVSWYTLSANWCSLTGDLVVLC